MIKLFANSVESTTCTYVLICEVHRTYLAVLRSCAMMSSALRTTGNLR